MKRVAQGRGLPEIANCTKYYEHDGMLRAYANRSMLLAMIFGVLALGSLAFTIYVRLQPPTVIRVDKNGDATVVGGPGSAARGFSLWAERASAAAPTDLEGRAVVRQFLQNYLAYTPDSVDRNMAAALNMMTTNLRTYTLNQLRDKNTIGKIKDDHIVSEFEIRSIEPVQGLPWTYTVFGVKEVHHVKQGTERIDQIVGRYNVRLVETGRTESNPSGLLVAQYGEQEMVGDRETGLLQQDAFDKDQK
jgi:type IV secretory pathway TrbF-like protein